MMVMMSSSRRAQGSHAEEVAYAGRIHKVTTEGDLGTVRHVRVESGGKWSKVAPKDMKEVGLPSGGGSRVSRYPFAEA